MAWLDSVDVEKERRGAARLRRCLLSAHGGICSIPWEDVVCPPRRGGETDRDKLLPPPRGYDQSAVSSDESEGEYVELSELPLPRFCPQRGSLTQSISLQHRGGGSTPGTTHTPVTHTPPSDTHSAATTHTCPGAPPAALRACTELTSHSPRCSRLLEEHLNQDHPGPVLVPRSSSPGPPVEDGGSGCQTDHAGGTGPEGGPAPKACPESEGGGEDRGGVGGQDWRREGFVEGGGGGEGELAKMKQEVVVCESEEKGEKEVKGERRDEEGREETVEEPEEVEVEEEVHVMNVSQNQREEEPVMKGEQENESELEKKGGGDLEDLYCENTTRHMHRDPYCERAPKQSEDTRTHTLPEDFYSEGNTHPNHSKNSYSESSEKQTSCEDSYSENISQPADLEDIDAERTSQPQPEDSSSERGLQLQPEDSYSERTPQSQTEDSYSESTLQPQPEDSYSERTSQPQTEYSYSERTLQPQPEDSYSESTLQPQSEDSYSESILQLPPEDSYSESPLHTELDDSYSESDTKLVDSEITPPQPSEFYFEKKTQQTHLEFFCSENTTHKENDFCSESMTLLSHSEDSYSEVSTLHTPLDMSSSQIAHSVELKTPQSVSTPTADSLQTQLEDSYSEKMTQETRPEDSYPDLDTQQRQLVDSLAAKTTQLEDFYSEITVRTRCEDSYSKNDTLWTLLEEPSSTASYSVEFNTDSFQTQSEDCYSDSTLHTYHKDSYSENIKQETLHVDSLLEVGLQKNQPVESDSESTLQPQPEDSYCESEAQTRQDKDICEPQTESHPSSTPETESTQTQPGDSYSESIQPQPEDSYSERTSQSQPEDSSSESTLQPQPEDSYSESILQPQPEDSYSESVLQQQPGDFYFENNMQETHLEVFCSENTIPIHSEGSSFENTTHKEKNFYSEDIILHSHSEDFYSESTVQTWVEDYCPDSSTHGRPLKDSVESETPTNSLQTQSRGSYSEKETLKPRLNREEPDSGQGEQEEQTEDEEERCCEDDGGRSAELLTEAVGAETSLAAGPGEPEPAAAEPTVQPQDPRVSQSRFYWVLLRSGGVCLPGTRDRGGRPLLTVSSSHPVWSNPECDNDQVLALLLYYTSTLREEARASRLTVLVDARRAAPPSALLSALGSLQEDSPGSVHAVLVLTQKDSVLHLDRPAGAQVEVLSSLKSLQKHLDLRQVPVDLGGSLTFSQSAWVSFRTRLEQLRGQCEDVVLLLQTAIGALAATPTPAAQDAEWLLSRYRGLMSGVVADGRLARLQREGGACLARLRREEGGAERRAAVEAVSSLYEQVDELLHRLVTLSNARTQQLHFLEDFRGLEQGFGQVRAWLEEVGEVRLRTLEEPADSLELLHRRQQDFQDFCTAAYERCKRGEELLARLECWDHVYSPDLQVYEDKVHSFWAQLQDFSQRVNGTGKNIQRAVQLYRFLDQAYGWALDGMRHLAGVSMEDCSLPGKCQDVIGSLEEYQQKHPPIPDGRFQEMKEEARELRGERGLRQWSFAWSKCQETTKMFHRKMEAAVRTRDSAHRCRSDSSGSRSSTSSRKTLSGLWGSRKTSSCSLEDGSVSPQHTPLLQRLFRRSSSEESPDPLEGSSSCSPAPPPSSFSSSSFFSRRQQMRKTQSFDAPPAPDPPRYAHCPRALSEPARRGNTGVFIRGLEVSSTEAAGRTLCPRAAAPRSPGTPTAEPRPRGSKLRHIVEETVTTEREYVRSLHYVIGHYFPEMEREDLPQDLRGKRSVVFGNLEKLLDFHSQFFLKELEACWKHPLRVPHCFLRHQEQFGLYALYSKNKPKSDALLANHGHAFFRRKQLELGDKMDLSSYLLKPVQRMSKYALLLSDLMKEVGVAREAELSTLEAATNMVKFQLRHGNDLLAMDAIRDCDVNLKEQGQLIRQDEFTVWSGRRRCQRRLFLFQELVLFSKPRRTEGGLDVFTYKHCFKTADVGLTESAGDDGRSFELWYRRRTSRNQTFVLQAPSPDVKEAWTRDVARILWTQAARNKETRQKEMVSMGVGNKPFLDIRPSEAAISDRAVHYIMKSRGARTRASIAVSVFDHSNPFKRGPGSPDTTPAGPLSSSLLGPLNLHLYSRSLPSSSAADSSFSSSCIEEDEQEHETSSQPSMTTDSSGSSSRCLSGSTGSDSGCVSSHLQEATPEETGPSGRRRHGADPMTEAAEAVGPAPSPATAV